MNTLKEKFHKNGTVKSAIYYIGDVRDGVARFYLNDNTLHYSVKYNYGRPVEMRGYIDGDEWEYHTLDHSDYTEEDEA